MTLGPVCKVLILPKKQSSDATICTLAHPRTGSPSRYLFDPEKGVYEFIRIAAPKSSRRSWLIDSRNTHQHARLKEQGAPQEDERASEKTSEGGENGERSEILNEKTERYVISKPEMLVATPIDPLFLLLPALSAQPASSNNSKQLFLSGEDYFDRLSDVSKHFVNIIKHDFTRKKFESRMQAVCDTVDAGEEKMYRLNHQKLLQELLAKANSIVNRGLPASMEDKFVRRALEMPVLSIRREDSSISEPPEADTLNVEESTESQKSTASSSEAASVSTDITIPDAPATPTDEDIRCLQRLRTAMTYITSSYIPTHLDSIVNDLLASEESPIDFKPLDVRLGEIAKVRAEALAARSLGDYSSKRNAYEDDEIIEARAAKKRKKEEEEKKKKSESFGVRNLRKADTSGMKKMSDFFGKAAAKKK